MARIRAPIAFPFAVPGQQSKKQQVSNCHGLYKQNQKKHHEEWWGKNTMATKTWTWIYKTDTTQDSTVKKKSKNKRKFYRCEPDHRIKHAQWRGPSGLILGTYLLVSRRPWALGRTFFHCLGWQRLRGRQGDRGQEKEERTRTHYSSFCTCK